MNSIVTFSPIVIVKNGQTFANSRDVAAFFGKQHKNVLRDIKRLQGTAPSCGLNFEPTSVHVPMPSRGFRNEPSFDMTKDGFCLLAMGFTGAKALDFKLKYIAAFNELEAELNAAKVALPDFNNPVAAARAWADEVEQKRSLQIENDRLKPLASVGARCASRSHTLNRFVRTLPGVNTMKTKSDLKGHGYLYSYAGSYRVYSKFMEFFEERFDGANGTVTIFPTPAGKAKLVELYETGQLTMKKGHAVA